MASRPRTTAWSRAEALISTRASTAGLPDPGLTALLAAAALAAGRRFPPLHAAAAAVLRPPTSSLLALPYGSRLLGHAVGTG